MYSSGFKNFLLVFAAALLLCYAGFANRYPLTYPDTGTYIISGFEGKVPEDRPLTYGLFARHISLFESLYLVIIAQGLLLAYLLFLFFKYMVSSNHKPVWYIFLVLLLTFFTGASVNVSQLIPDIFTPLMLLSFCLLFSSHLKRKEAALVGIIFVFAVSTHASHPLICFIMLFLFTLTALLFFKHEQLITRKMLGAMWLLCIAGSVITPSVHYLYNGKFQTSNATHIFFMYKLNEMGILDSYLDKKCPTIDLKICPYKDSIPHDFIWDWKHSPAYKNGGWEANKEEYNFIIRDALTTPVYLKKFIEKAISHSIAQFFLFDTGDTPRADSNSPPHYVVKRYFYDDLRVFESSDQNIERLNYTYLNNRQYVLIICSAFLLFAIWSVWGSTIPVALKQTVLVVVFGLIANAIACGSLSSVIDRYQSRVIWLLPIMACLLILSKRQEIMQVIRGRG